MSLESLLCWNLALLKPISGNFFFFELTFSLGNTTFFVGNFFTMKFDISPIFIPEHLTNMWPWIRTFVLIALSHPLLKFLLLFFFFLNGLFKWSNWTKTVFVFCDSVFYSLFFLTTVLDSHIIVLWMRRIQINHNNV